MAEDPKPKRGSIIRKKRSGSVKVKPTKGLTNHQRAGSEPLCTTDVSILVTEPSPEAPTPTESRTTTKQQQYETSSTIVQVLVHRESEEYNQEVDNDMGVSGDNDHSTVVVVDGDEEVTLVVLPPPEQPQEGNNVVKEHQDS